MNIVIVLVKLFIASSFIVLFPYLAFYFISYFIKKSKYEKSFYYQQTKLPYKELIKNKGKIGEYKISDLISFLDGYKKIIFNSYIPTPDGRTTEIDVLMIHESGIYLFESKNYSGWIFGNEKQQEWVQSFSNGRKSKKIHFPNPIIQNHVHMKWLQNFLRDNSFPFYSFIVFGNDCELKNVTITSGNHAVVEQYQLFDCVNRTALAHQGCLQPEKIDELYEKLMPLTQKSLAEKEKHIEI